MTHNVLALLLTTVTVFGACQASHDDAHGTAGTGAASGGPATGEAGAGAATAGGAGGAASRGGTGGTRPLEVGGSGAAGAGGSRAGGAGLSQGGGGAATDGGEAGKGGEGGKGEGGKGEGGEPDARESFYISTVVNDRLVVGSLDVSQSVPSLPPGSPLALATGANTLAVDSTQRFVFVSREPPGILGDGHIDTYRIADDGSLPAEPDSSLPTQDVASSIVPNPHGKFVYVATFSRAAIDVFEVDPQTAALGDAGVSLPLDSSLAFLAIDPSGSFLYASQRSKFGIRAFHIDAATGALSELAGSPFGATAIPQGANVAGGGIVIKPSGDYLYTSGADVPRPPPLQGFTGALNAFSIAPDGKLALVEESPFTLDVQSDAQAPNIAMDPRGEYVYVSNFIFTRHVSGFSISPGSGALTPVTGSPVTASSPYSLALDPSGRFVFVGEDGMGTRVYALNRANGKLDEVTSSPFTFGGFEPKIVFATPRGQP